MAGIEAFVNWTLFTLAVSVIIGVATASAPWCTYPGALTGRGRQPIPGR